MKKNTHKKPSLKVMLVGAEDEENLAVRYLGGALKKAGYEVLISPCARYEQFENTLWQAVRFNPELIGISMPFQSVALMYFDLINQIKEILPKTHIIVGGHFPTFEYKKILDTQKSIDSVGRFEGEKTMTELAEHLFGKRKIKDVTNLVWKDGDKIVENKCFYDFMPLDELPFPVRDKESRSCLGEKFATLISSRGCWHSSCLYCCIGAFHKQKPVKFKLRHPKFVAEEVAELFHKKGVRIFQFHDDNFVLPSRAATANRISEMESWLGKYHVPVNEVAFLIKVRPDTIDKDVAKRLKKLGAICIFLGIENACDSGLVSLCRRADEKINQNAIDCLHSEGIAITYNLLIFHPKATPEEIKKNVQFMNSHKDFPFDFGRAEICAATPLETLLKSENGIEGKWPNFTYTIQNKEVERMFQIYRKTFRDKKTSYANLAHLNEGLGYHIKIIERLHPGSIQRKLIVQAENMIREAGSFIGGQVAILSTSLNREWTEDEINAFRSDLRSGCETRIKDMEKITEKLIKLTEVEKIFSKFGVKEKAQSFLTSLPIIN